jgi:hypothetical protein
MVHSFTITIELSDDEYQTVGRAAGGMGLHFQQQGSPIAWTVEKELAALLRRAIADERIGQQQRDNIATLLRYGAAPGTVYRPSPVPAPPWLAPMGPTPGEVIGIMPSDPRDLDELGMQCPACGRVHDVSGRVTGDKVYCPCGANVLVQHQARVIDLNAQREQRERGQG